LEVTFSLFFLFITAGINFCELVHQVDYHLGWTAHLQAVQVYQITESKHTFVVVVAFGFLKQLHLFGTLLLLLSVGLSAFILFLLQVFVLLLKLALPIQKLFQLRDGKEYRLVEVLGKVEAAVVRL